MHFPCDEWEFQIDSAIESTAEACCSRTLLIAECKQTNEVDEEKNSDFHYIRFCFGKRVNKWRMTMKEFEVREYGIQRSHVVQSAKYYCQNYLAVLLNHKCAINVYRLVNAQS